MVNYSYETEPPEWHRKHLEDREQALADGEDSFIDLDEFEKDLNHTEDVPIELGGPTS